MEVKGIAMNARLHFVRNRFGLEGEEKVFDRLPGLRSDLTGSDFMPSKMYPYDVYVEFNQAVDDLFFDGDESSYLAMGEESAAYALNTVHKVFVASHDVKNFIRSLPVIYGAYYRSLGEATTLVEGMENRATARITGVSKPHRSLCQITYGYMKKGMELCGARDVRIVEEACLCRNEPDCCLTTTWQ